MDDEPGYWAVLRHADVVHVAKHSEIFSATEGGVVVETSTRSRSRPCATCSWRWIPSPHGVPQAGRAGVQGAVIAELDGRVREVVRGIFDHADQSGPDVEFVHDVCAHLPSQILGEIMGLPAEDWPAIHAMAERNSGSQDPDVSDGQERGSASIEMAMYAMQFAADRRASGPQGDLTDVLLGEEFDGHLMTDIDFARFFVQLVTAGNDTTRTMLSSGTLALLDHPDQLAALRADPSGIPRAVEEILRWANPLHYFRRTAMVDTELGGQAISAGDKVAMIYTAANRDPPCSRIPTGSTRPEIRIRTCRSGLRHTSASACISPDSKDEYFRGNAASLALDRADRRSHPATLESQ